MNKLIKALIIANIYFHITFFAHVLMAKYIWQYPLNKDCIYSLVAVESVLVGCYVLGGEAK